MRGLLSFLFVCVVGLLVVAVICSPFALLDYWTSSVSCSSKWGRSGMQSEYTFFGGCMVRRADGTWVPAGTIRDVAP